MSLPLSFTSAIAPTLTAPTLARPPQDAIKPPQTNEPQVTHVASYVFSENSRNTQNLLNSLTRDLSSSAPLSAKQPMTRGQQPQQGDYSLALLAKDVYSLMGQGSEGFSRLSDQALLGFGIDPAGMLDPASGFQAGIYTDEQHYVLAFAGTNDMRDWLSNVRQATGYEDMQYNHAVALAKSAKAAFGDALMITGHSLGGGLAATAALATGTLAVTFNAAGVSDHTLNRFGINPAAAKQDAESGGIRRYSEQYDMLTGAQESTSLLPDAIGHKITLVNNDTLSGIDDWRPSKHLDRSLTAHGIDKVIGSMLEQKPWETRANA
ncbi:phospholipase [Serratia sp. L9]|uniref:phospholipase n=1 Tax=Serratia sp. L9 TaxID=3423946 RepID=UPI003D6685C2